MTGVKKQARALRRDPVLRTKIWLEVDGHYVFGGGISDILKAVADTGSIKAAAKSLGKRYRHVWSKSQGDRTGDRRSSGDHSGRRTRRPAQ